MANCRRKPAARPVNLHLLNNIAGREDAALDNIRNYNGPIVPLDEDEAPHGEIWEALQNDEVMRRSTNMTRAMITSLYQSMLPHITALRRRGPRPASTWMDCLLCYLVWARAPGKDFDKLASAVGLPCSRFQDNVARARPIVLAALCQRWLSPRRRPLSLVGTNYPEIALLIDCHTTEGFRPKAPFEEAKIYWDGKNHIYGFKNEVGVTASPPHYCLFAAPHTVPSVHDYQYHKRFFEQYLPYLLKTPADHHALPHDVQHRFWAVCGDKGYIGPETDTPDERRITPKKGQLTQAERVENTAINRIRVPVEQFFGRLMASWGILHGVYRWDHANFDADFQICALLTNELIQHSQLVNLDAEFYAKYISQRRTKAEERERKRAQQLATYAANKHARTLREEELARMEL